MFCTQAPSACVHCLFFFSQSRGVQQARSPCLKHMLHQVHLFPVIMRVTDTYVFALKHLLLVFAVFLWLFTVSSIWDLSVLFRFAISAQLSLMRWFFS